MSIVLKGMTMPKAGECVVIYSDGTAHKYRGGDVAVYGYKGRISKIVAIEPPPHGDLIDRSKLGLTDFEIVMCDGSYRQGLEMLIAKIDNAPAVIEAEGRLFA